MSALPQALARAARRPMRSRGGARRTASRVGRRAFRAVRGTHWAVQTIVAIVLLVTIWVPVNWMVQVIRKPAELLGAVSGSTAKVPAATWDEYGSLFDAHSTAVVTPELLAALAQVESSGDPAALTYWRWRFSWNPFEVYRPASSAVGMFQITDGTFEEARRYCIHDHVVVEEGSWNDLRGCWFNGLYTRVVASHAVEMTAASLDRAVARTVARHGRDTASLQQRQDLAAIIHLCGGGTGDAYVRRGFRFSRGQRCGAHDPRHYVARVNALKRQFARMASAD
jgi:transglycosylase-like protein with SLT domain